MLRDYAPTGSDQIAKRPPSKLYTAAPITEAVAEVRFSTPVDLRKLQTLSGKFSRDYPNEVQQKTRAVSVDFETKAASFTDEEDILRRTSSDEADIVVLTSKRISVSRLAPYTEWSDFRRKIERALSMTLNARPRRLVERVGLRYLNRVDIPTHEGIAEHEKFLNVYIHLPKTIESIGPYALNFAAMHNDFAIHVQSGKAEAPVPDTLAIILDVDVMKLEGAPSELESLLALFDEMRVEKNLLFESFVTNKARKLFDNV